MRSIYSFLIFFFLGCNQPAISPLMEIAKKDCITCNAPSRKVTIDSIVSYRNKDAKGNIDMVLITGGTFKMGNEEFTDAKPVHVITVSSFLMDAHEVTNKEFNRFVKATNYITVAERQLDPKDYPGVPPNLLVPGSAVFTPSVKKVQLDNPLQWWQYVAGADWRHPKGIASSIKGHEMDPVVQVCYDDAVAYAQWAGKRLPTEAEWEYAARAGKNYSQYYWGTALKPKGKWVANIYQGSFPDNNTLEDGFKDIAPVESYPANAFGLFDMEGNVWEWCADYYRPDYYNHSPAKNPKGPADSFDPEEPSAVKRVQRGGSFICSDDYCNRYKAGSRGKGEISSAGNNIGFRCVKDID